MAKDKKDGKKASEKKPAVEKSEVATKVIRKASGAEPKKAKARVLKSSEYVSCFRMAHDGERSQTSPNKTVRFFRRSVEGVTVNEIKGLPEIEFYRSHPSYEECGPQGEEVAIDNDGVAVVVKSGKDDKEDKE